MTSISPPSPSGWLKDYEDVMMRVPEIQKHLLTTGEIYYAHELSYVILWLEKAVLSRDEGVIMRRIEQFAKYLTWASAPMFVGNC